MISPATLENKNKKNQRARRWKKNSGFTFIELLIVVAIMLLVLAISVPIYGNLESSAQISETNTNIAQILRRAKWQSIAGLNNSAFGVYFDTTSNPNRIISFQGNSYANRDQNFDVIFELPKVLSATTTFTNQEVIFSKNIGRPSESGTTTINHAVIGSKDVFINELGLIEEND